MKYFLSYVGQGIFWVLLFIGISIVFRGCTLTNQPMIGINGIIIDTRK
mgnify:CR=1 FL=1